MSMQIFVYQRVYNKKIPLIGLAESVDQLHQLAMSSSKGSSDG
jgi:hypothetical protein